MPTANKTIRAAVIGATGYTGQELLRLLSQHEHIEITAVSSRSSEGKSISDIYPHLRKHVSLICQEQDIEKISENADLVFIAVPHGEAASMVTPAILERSIIIDLGADFRLKDAQEYKEWYKLEHPNPALIEKAVYGLAELNKEAISQARLIANPGCYATCSILALTPLLKHDLIKADSIVIDAKSGVSGAGRGLALTSHFNEVNENIKAYAVGSHRHTPEIEQALKDYGSSECPNLSFTPHLIPMNRGILITAYAELKNNADSEKLKAAYENTYKDCQFIRLFDSDKEDSPLPETRFVEGSNFCDIAFRIDRRANRVVVLSALDNLVKGAAGQAIQNMNLIFGFSEQCGLEHLPLFP